MSRPPELNDLDPARLLVLRLVSALVFGFYRIWRGDRLVVGRGVIANHRLIIKGPGRVIDIGEDSILGQAFVADTDAHSVRLDRRSHPLAPVRSAPVVVGANAWVARGAAILPGVRIGEGSVVGYGSVVTSDVPAGVAVAGNPAKVVRHLDEVG